MKANISCVIALIVCMFSLSVLPNVSHATNSNANHSGVICRNYNAADAKDIDYLDNGLWNLNPLPRPVICPIVRTAPGANNNRLYVHVNGSADPGQVITCTLFSYMPDGTLLGSFASPALTGSFDSVLSVPAGFLNYASVLCSLPGNRSGIIYDVNVPQ